MRSTQWALVALLGLLATACGTRLTNAQIETAAYGSRTAAPASPAAAGTTGGSTTASPSVGDGAGAAPGDAATPAAGSSPSGDPGSSLGATGEASSAGATAPSGAPIVIGQIGTFSGVLGAALIGFRQAAQAWVASVNGNGGLNGHPVKLVSMDDGGDGAKGAALVQDMVENQHVIAFVASPLLTSGSSMRQYLEQKRIPVVGGDVGDEFWHQSPMFFPQLAFINNLQYSAAFGPIQAGKKNFALLSCAEIAACGALVQYERSAVEKQGGKVVYEAKISIAAPDYTAQCIQARQAGADAAMMLVDPATINRFSKSCGRQAFHPTYSGLAAILPSDFASNPELEGFRGATPSFPWFVTSGSPAFEQYGSVMKRYFPNTGLSGATSQGWTAMKLFERATSETLKAGEAPTTNAILRGLWSIKNETLGGLTPPITFVTNGPAVRGNCGFIVGVEKGKLSTPNGLKLICGDV